MTKIKRKNVSKNVSGYHLFFSEERAKIIKNEGSANAFTKDRMRRITIAWNKLDTVSRVQYEIRSKDEKNSELRESQKRKDTSEQSRSGNWECKNQNTFHVNIDATPSAIFGRQVSGPPLEEGKSLYGNGLCNSQRDTPNGTTIQDPQDTKAQSVEVPCLGTEVVPANHVSSQVLTPQQGESESLCDIVLCNDRRDTPHGITVQDPQDSETQPVEVPWFGTEVHFPDEANDIYCEMQDFQAEHQLTSILKTISDLETHLDHDLVNFLHNIFP